MNVVVLRSLPARAAQVAASYGLTCVIVILLMGLTYLGTYQQKDIGLIAVQDRYFTSFFWWFEVGPLAVPLPGAFLLLSILAINLICGGFVRIQWCKRTAGVLIVHSGVLLLLLAGLVNYLTSTNGYVRLRPGEQTSEYVSFREWELVIAEPLGDGAMRELLVPDAELRRLPTATSHSLPFAIRITRYFDNCIPRRASIAEAREVVDGFYLAERPERPDMPSIPGAYVEIVSAGEKPLRGMLWGRQRYPWAVEVAGATWTLDLRSRVFDLPFAVRLDEFEKEAHPGVDTPRLFASDVTRIQGGIEQRFRIAMNEPMRYGGFMFSQNSWGPQDGSPGPYWSMLEVSSNPSDQWPKYACYVIALGLLWHFVRKLVTHLERLNRRAAS